MATMRFEHAILFAKEMLIATTTIVPKSFDDN